MKTRCYGTKGTSLCSYGIHGFVSADRYFWLLPLINISIRTWLASRLIHGRHSVDTWLAHEQQSVDSQPCFNQLIDCRLRWFNGVLIQGCWRVSMDGISQHSTGNVFRKEGEFLKKLCCCISGEYYTVLDNWILSTGLVMWIDHSKKIWKLMFGALVLCWSEYTCTPDVHVHLISKGCLIVSFP